MSDESYLPRNSAPNVPQRSFMVRCWFADAAHTRPHFVVLDVLSGEQHHFAELDLLLDFLGQEIVNAPQFSTR